MTINNIDIKVNAINSFKDKPNTKKDSMNNIPLNNSNKG